ncbi:MAG: (d)CMP kinase [Actinomycetota bacterium]|nr:(d)CMP kinase [Actinomycetota bacterium]
MIVAIDGPAGAGKSTVARGVARALGIRHLDTGAMYRALTWKAMAEKVEPSDGAALAALARRTSFTFGPSGIIVDGRPMEREIRSRRVGHLVSMVSAHPAVRRELVLRQRAIVDSEDAVIEGRDIGTVVCPGADVKVFLTASAAERARRRHRELLRSGMVITYRTLKRELVRRDALDATRPVSPLAPAEDAYVIDSTARSSAEVVAEIIGLVRAAQRRS